MSQLPDFFAPASNAKTLKVGNFVEGNCYRSLLAVWFIDILLLTDGHRRMGQGSRFLLDEDDEPAKLIGFTVTKIAGDKEDEPTALLIDGKKVARNAPAIAKELRKHADRFRQMPVSDDLSLFANVSLLGSVLGMNRAEQAVLCFAAMLDAIPMFKGSIDWMNVRLPLSKMAALIAQLTGNDGKEILAALQPESVLRASGIIQISDFRNGLGDTLDLVSGFGSLLCQPHASADTLIEKFVRKAEVTQLSVADYPHLAADSVMLTDYFASAIQGAETGCNVLFYGIPGTGKTEYAKVLADKLGMELYEISFADEDGDPVRGDARLRAYNLCQRILAGRSNALLMFDEIEDVFPMGGMWQMLFGDEDGAAGKNNAKAWVNRSLEQNRTPAIWITNNGRIDKAYLRRFDYSVRFAIPPQQVRKEMARLHLGAFNPGEDWLSRIASNEQFIPAQYERAAKLARLGAKGDTTRAIELAEMALDRSATLLGQKATPKRNVLHTEYDLRFVNTSLPLEDMLIGLNRERQGTFCFYGPAGTGKSEFARHIADRLGMPCIVRRASDILSKWVGESEKNIAEMFAEVRQQSAVLVLDEADSFLADRRDAQHSWEVTQVNELLTQMEAFDGIFVCTTNLMDKLDQASLRRFSFKLKFDFLNSDQRWAMFKNEFIRLGGNESDAADCEHPVRRLEKLTPGDFSAVARQLSVLGSPVTADGLYRQLQEECMVKGGSAGKIGFV